MNRTPSGLGKSEMVKYVTWRVDKLRCIDKVRCIDKDIIMPVDNI